MCSVTRGHAWPQRWGSRASVTSNPARLTFPLPTFPPELLGVQNESSEAQCDLLSCLHPSLTHQGKTSTQMARESSEPARTPTVPPKLLESLLLVSEGIQTLVPEQPCPTLRERGNPEVRKNRNRRALLGPSRLWLIPFSSCGISQRGHPGLCSYCFPGAGALQPDGFV